MTKLQQVFMQNLKRERLRTGMTQEEMAERSGISHKYYGAIELGYKFPSIQKLDNIVTALGISASRLFIDREGGNTLSPEELITDYNELLENRFRDELKTAKGIFLESIQ